MAIAASVDRPNHFGECGRHLRVPQTAITPAPEHPGGRVPDLADLLFPLLLDLRCLAAKITQVVKLGTADIAARHDLDPVDGRAVHRVGPLDADAEADLADRERLTESGTLAADHHTLEDLDPGPVALDDAAVHLDGVTGPEVGDVGPLRLGIERVQRVHRDLSLALKVTGMACDRTRQPHYFA